MRNAAYTAAPASDANVPKATAFANRLPLVEPRSSVSTCARHVAHTTCPSTSKYSIRTCREHALQVVSFVGAFGCATSKRSGVVSRTDGAGASEDMCEMDGDTPLTVWQAE